jgi:septal ring factor EnvC (AmiA/AmiB activator)
VKEVAALLLAFVLVIVASGVVAQSGKGGKSDAPSPQRQRELQAEQRQLQARLAQLKKQLAAAEESQSDAADALADSEAAISVANRTLRELAAARRQVERQIAALTERGRQTGARQSDAERELGQLLRAQYALSRVEPWQRLIDGENPAQLARERVYLDYLARARASTVSVLRERREELAELETESRAKQKELDEIAAEERSNRATLLKQQLARKQTLERLSKRIATQRQSIASLERDDRRLSSLIDKLAKLLAEPVRRVAPPTRGAKPSAPNAVPNTAPTRDFDPPGYTAFERLRGRLPMPVAGDIAARFGAPRRVEGAGTAPTWKGVFIRAAEGAEVKSVAAGQVVFADWLRGFGNLIIVDHGEGFLSVYGNNESLLQPVGERVGGGEVIASVGNTGGNVDAGLYFELRFNGRPIDPLRWVAAR